MQNRAKIILASAIASSALCLTSLAGPRPLAATPSDDDKKFVADAASGGLAEVKLGQYAEENASNAEVKKFGKHMVTDHTKANKKLESIAKNEKIDVPSTLSAEDQATVDKLTALKGDAFDKAYTAAMVSDHEKDIADFKKEADGGSDSAIKKFAADTVPTLEKHLKMAKQADKDINGGTK